jgi:cell division protein FtsL
MAGRAMPIQMSLGLRPASTADQQGARFHRESDRKRLRAMLVGIAAAGVVVSLVLGLVGLRMQQVRLSYRLDILRTTRAAVEETNRRLLVEKATLQSLGRIEVEARTRLGMIAPTQQQVQLAREFVGGGTVSAALGGRTAAAGATAHEPGRAPGREPSRDSAREPAREPAREIVR